jgi:LacI family transcriptional regulator
MSSLDLSEGLEERAVEVKRVGIRDVAAAAGVSVTTVSHILNEVASARINASTRERVKAEAARLGYGPNRMARGLRTNRYQALGLLSEEIATTPHAGLIIRGAQDAAEAADFTIMLINTPRDSTTISRDIEALLNRQVDGVLFATMFHRVIDVPGELVGKPTVLIDASSTGRTVPSVVPDEVGGAYAAVNELLNHGHRRIGFANNIADIPASVGRLIGYRQALAERGIAYDPSLVVRAESESAGGYLAVRALLDRPDRPEAIFCFNDRMAMGAYRLAAELGLRIPNDVSIVGFDNQTIIAEGLYPPLTTVALPHYEMGVWAVETLIQLLAGEQPPGPFPKIIACPLIRRASVAIANR